LWFDLTQILIRASCYGVYDRTACAQKIGTVPFKNKLPFKTPALMILKSPLQSLSLQTFPSLPFFFLFFFHDLECQQEPGFTLIQAASPNYPNGRALLYQRFSSFASDFWLPMAVFPISEIFSIVVIVIQLLS